MSRAGEVTGRSAAWRCSELRIVERPFCLISTDESAGSLIVPDPHC